MHIADCPGQIFEKVVIAPRIADSAFHDGDHGGLNRQIRISWRPSPPCHKRIVSDSSATTTAILETQASEKSTGQGDPKSIKGLRWQHKI